MGEKDLDLVTKPIIWKNQNIADMEIFFITNENMNTVTDVQKHFKDKFDIPIQSLREIFIRCMPKYGYNKRIIMLRKFVRLGIFARVELMGDSFYLVNPAVVCNGGTLNVLVWEIFNLTNLTKKYNFREKVQNDERIVALWKEIYNG